MQHIVLPVQEAAAGGQQPHQATGDPQPDVDLCCTITKELFYDPVILVESGHTYERAAIEHWLADHEQKRKMNRDHKVIDPETGAWPAAAVRCHCAGQALCLIQQHMGCFVGPRRLGVTGFDELTN